MIKKEHQTWLILGGEISGQELADDLILKLRKTNSFQNLPPDIDQDAVLTKAALNILAADQAHLIHILHTARMALCAKEYAKAEIIIDKAFKK